MNPRDRFGIWLALTNDSAECFTGTSETSGAKDWWDIAMLDDVIGVAWILADRRWTVDKFDVRMDPVPLRPMPCDGVRGQSGRITYEDVEARGATLGSAGSMP